MLYIYAKLFFYLKRRVIEGYDGVIVSILSIRLCPEFFEILDMQTAIGSLVGKVMN